MSINDNNIIISSSDKNIITNSNNYITIQKNNFDYLLLNDNLQNNIYYIQLEVLSTNTNTNNSVGLVYEVKGAFKKSMGIITQIKSTTKFSWEDIEIANVKFVIKESNIIIQVKNPDNLSSYIWQVYSKIRVLNM